MENNRPKKFTIDRSKWRRGGSDGLGLGDTLLLNQEGFMCCLGQISEQCGVPLEHLAGRSTTGTLPAKGLDTAGWRLNLSSFLVDYSGVASHSSELARKAVRINDDYVLIEEKREAQLKELFAAAGYEIEFIN